MRDYNHPAFRTCHLGASGIGKNTDFLPRLQREAKKAKWIFVFDHKREFSEKLGLPVCESEAQLAHAVGTGPFPRWVLYDFHAQYQNRKEGFQFFCQAVYDLAQTKDCRGRKIFVADEIQEVAGPSDQCDEFITLLDDGRSLKIDAMLIGQSPNGIHTMIRNQWTQIFLFKQEDDNAMAFLLKLGFKEEHVRNLQPGEWLWKNTRSGKFAKGGKAFQPDGAGVPTGGSAL